VMDMSACLEGAAFDHDATGSTVADAPGFWIEEEPCAFDGQPQHGNGEEKIPSNAGFPGGRRAGRFLFDEFKAQEALPEAATRKVPKEEQKGERSDPEGPDPWLKREGKRDDQKERGRPRQQEPIENDSCRTETERRRTGGTPVRNALRVFRAGARLGGLHDGLDP